MDKHQRLLLDEYKRRVANMSPVEQNEFDSIFIDELSGMAEDTFGPERWLNALDVAGEVRS